MRALLFLGLLVLTIGCERFQNDLARTVLDCGPEARDWTGSFVKVLDPSGRELDPSAALEARQLQISLDGRVGESLPVSSRACIQVASDSTLVIRSKLRDRHWSRIVRAPSLPWDRRVRLEENSAQSLQVHCPQPNLTDGELPLPLVFGAKTEPLGFAISTILDRPDGSRLETGFLLHKNSQFDHLLIPANWLDGEAWLHLNIRNLLEEPASPLASTAYECRLVLDRAPPRLIIEPSVQADGLLEQGPGDKIILSIEDAHPESIHWCLAPMEDLPCQPATKASSPVNILMPSSGQWRLQAIAEDALGHQSKLLTQPIKIIQHDLIASIKARAGRARAEQASDGLKAAETVLGALIDFERLVLPDEMAQVENQLVDSLLELAPYVREHNRQRIKGDGRRVWAIKLGAEEAYLALSDCEATLWSSGGKLLDKIAVHPNEIADWSGFQQGLLVAGQFSLQWLEIVDLKFRLVSELNLASLDFDGPPKLLQWIPQQAAFVLAGQHGQAAILQAKASQISLLQRLDIKDVTQLALDSKGRFLAMAASDSSFAIWQYQTGTWQLVLEDERSATALQFASSTANEAIQLLLLGVDGRLHTWTPGTSWKTVDKDGPIEIPSQGGGLRPIHSLQAFADGHRGLIERGGRFFQWRNVEPLQLELVRMEGGFAWDRLQQWAIDACRGGVWMQDHESISYWEWRSSDAASLVKLAEWSTHPGQPVDFSSNCSREELGFASLDAKNGQLRFWTESGPALSLIGDTQETTVNSWWPRPEGGEQLITAGFDGILRFWTSSAKKLTQFLGHKGQVTEVRWEAPYRLWLSSAEDASTRLWNERGEEIAKLDLATEGNANLRDAAIMGHDGRHIVSTGSGLLGFWQLDEAGVWNLESSQPISPGQRAGTQSLFKRADGAILARFTRATDYPPSHSLKIFQENGEPWPLEEGEPNLKQLLQLDIAADGSCIALMRAKQDLQIWRWSDAKWQQESISLPEGLWSDLKQVYLSSDAQELLTVFEHKNLLLWRHHAGVWQLEKQRVLPDSTRLERGLRWRSKAGDFAFADQNQLMILDANLEEKHRLQVFPEPGTLGSWAWSEQKNLLAISQGRRVRILDFNLKSLRQQLCSYLTDYLNSSRDDLERTAYQDFCRRYGD